MHTECLLTIFTPTYNRIKHLSLCYKSLINQTNQDFIWQIIDDGSTDDTEETINKWISENKINIEYFKKNNGGKVSAINESLKISYTKLWVCLDSDDYFVNTAVEAIFSKYELIKGKEDICGIFALRSDKELQPMNKKKLPKNLLFENQFNIRYKYKIEPEYVQIYKFDIIKNYPYPIFENERFTPLSYVQNLIDQKYKFLLVSEPLMVCEYIDDGITKNHKKLVLNNPKSNMLFAKQMISLSNNIFVKLKYILIYNMCHYNIIYENHSFIDESLIIKNKLIFLIYPLGIILYIIYSNKITKE